MNKKILTLVMFSAIVLPIASAQAQDSATTLSPVRQKNAVVQQQRLENQQMREEFKDTREKMQTERCQNIEARVRTRLNRYENNEQMSEKVYGNMTSRLDRLVAKLEAAGADVTKLKTDLQTLQTKITKLQEDHESFIAKMKETQTFACGKSEGEFKNKLGESSKVLPLIKQDRAEIKEFFQTVIKNDLQEIRKQLVDEKSSN